MRQRKKKNEIKRNGRGDGGGRREGGQGGGREIAEERKVAQEEGEEEHCENRSLPEVCIFLHQPSMAAPPVYTRPLRDYCSHLPSFSSPGNCSVEWGHHTTRGRLKYVLKKKTRTERAAIVSGEIRKKPMKDMVLSKVSKLNGMGQAKKVPSGTACKKIS